MSLHKNPKARHTVYRSAVKPADPAAVGKIVADTGFFTRDEIAIAIELVDETLEKGEASGYQFVLADDALTGELKGYACFGQIPATEASFDLYWIAVAPDAQRCGLGKSLLAKAEAACKATGAAQVYIETSGRKIYESTRAFYENMSYQVAAEFEDFYAPGDSKIVYVKRYR